MRSRRGAAGALRGAGYGGGKTPSTGAGCAGSTRRAALGTGADQNLSLGLYHHFTPLIPGVAAKHANTAFVLGLVELLRHRPFGGEGVARPHGLLEAAGVLEIGDRSAREVHADARRDERARERAVQDAAAEDRAACELFVDVQGIEVAEHAGAEDEVRFGHGDTRAELVTDLHLVVPLAR